MKLFISASSREKNCFDLLNDIKSKDDELISLSDKNIRFCLGCNSCINKLDKHCVLDDYISNELYDKILKSDKIVIASPLYMSNISGLLKNLIDRLYPFYNHNLFNGQEICLILLGQASKEDNEEEINGIIRYFEGISEWMNFKFKFIDYLCTGDPNSKKNIKDIIPDYDIIKEKLMKKI